jgi:hypothetical protein
MIFYLKFPVKKKISEDIIEECDMCKKKSILSLNQFRQIHLVFFIPIFGEKKQFIKCSNCGEHYVHSSYWHSFIEGKFQKDIINYEKFPMNKESALKVLEFYKLQNNKEKRLEAAVNLEKNHSEDTDVLYKIADVYLKCNMLKDSLRIFDKLYLLKNDNNVRYQIASLSIKTGDYNTAYKMLIESGKPFFPNSYGIIKDLLKLIIATANFHLANSLINIIIENYIENAKNDFEFRSIVRQVEKQIGISQSILPKSYRILIVSSILTGIVIIIFLSFFGFNYFLEKNHKIYFVNGFKSRVSINMKNTGDKDIEAEQVLNTYIPEGNSEIFVKLNDKNSYKDIISVKRSNFFDRIIDAFVNKKFYVYNIDNGGVILWEEIEYKISYLKNNTDDNSNDSGNYEIYAGERFYDFQNIDYPFTDIPTEIQLDGFQSSAKKTGLSLLKIDPEKITIYMIDENYPVDLIKNYIKAQVESGYENPFLKSLYDESNKTGERKKENIL